jgi:hypothetical protein|tara:strand:+ start:885 stop:1043 length:159 start_codon:yes stop_codon:yes gene_type:complete
MAGKWLFDTKAEAVKFANGLKQRPSYKLGKTKVYIRKLSAGRKVLGYVVIIE